MIAQNLFPKERRSEGKMTVQRITDPHEMDLCRQEI